MSAGNLAAVLADLPAVPLYDGPASDNVSLSSGVSGFDRVYIEVEVGNWFCIGTVRPSDIVSGRYVNLFRFGASDAVLVTIVAGSGGTSISSADCDFTKVIGIRD